MVVYSHCTKEEAVFVSGVARGEVVEVEYPDTECSKVGTEAEIGHHTHRQNLRIGNIFSIISLFTVEPRDQWDRRKCCIRLIPYFRG